MTRLTSSAWLIISAFMLANLLPFPDIGPDLFRIEIAGFTLAIRYYALAYIIGLIAGWRLVVFAVSRPRFWGREGAPMPPSKVEDLLTWIIVGVIVGGRLGYVLFYQPAQFAQNPIDILKVWQGGMSFHGGFAGVVVATWLFSRRYDIRLGSLSDLMALAAPIGLLLGRLANFINAELWGRPTDVPWAVQFPGAAAQDCPDVIGICARHPSQLYEAGLEGLLLGTLLLILAFSRGWLKQPWSITGTFLLGYGASRYFVELFRQADAQFITPDNPFGYAIQFGTFGMSMGQILSLPMILVGAWLIARTASAPRSP